MESEPGVLVHPSSDRRLAVEHWLLSTLPPSSHARARTEWQEHQVAMLPLGGLLAAVRIPGRLVYALTGTDAPSVVDPFLAECLDGGPVICDPHHGGRYYALVPGRVPVTWRRAADDWRDQDVDVLGRETVLGIPRVDAQQFIPGACVSYWSVPMPSAGVLCPPLTVARLIAAGRHQLAEELEA
ncbi:hypothetical protein [Streptomyces cadmiisoli]|uniref:hypothetical protein n=1 Tax=Streptomyces cadmiisoli TaxID=2184053 RepID=UPI003D735952